MDSCLFRSESLVSDDFTPNWSCVHDDGIDHTPKDFPLTIRLLWIIDIWHSTCKCSNGFFVPSSIFFLQIIVFAVYGEVVHELCFEKNILFDQSRTASLISVTFIVEEGIGNAILFTASYCCNKA